MSGARAPAVMRRHRRPQIVERCGHEQRAIVWRREQGGNLRRCVLLVRRENAIPLHLVLERAAYRAPDARRLIAAAREGLRQRNGVARALLRGPPDAAV